MYLDNEQGNTTFFFPCAQLMISIIMERHQGNGGH